MIDFEKIYDSFTDELAGNQKRLDVNTVLGVYYGVSSDAVKQVSEKSKIEEVEVNSETIKRVKNLFKTRKS